MNEKSGSLPNYLSIDSPEHLRDQMEQASRVVLNMVAAFAQAAEQGREDPILLSLAENILALEDAPTPLTRLNPKQAIELAAPLFVQAERPKDVLNISVSDLFEPTGDRHDIRKILEHNGVLTVGDMAPFGIYRFMRMQHFGRKNLDKLTGRLEELGIQLQDDVPR